ncbi:MAG: HNH endonuclease [Chloroflexi bacterium]|nr:HNH endonuclease [Chloroflexota bacterium]
MRGRNRRFCDEHQSEEWKRQDAERGSAAERGYDAQWQKTRDRYLQDHPRCERCGRSRAILVHHRVRIVNGGSDDSINLQALCKLCHAQVHAEAGELFASARRGRQG